MVKIFFLILLVTIPLHGEPPWGKDASLHRESKQKTRFISHSPLYCLVAFHQQVLSAADGPRSHFYPCSSEYARQAICTYGALVGYTLGCDRLLRENSDEWFYKKIGVKNGISIKYDPLPHVVD